MEPETKKEVFQTSIEEIDTLLAGGIRAGSLVLIEGATEAGASALSQRLAYQTLHTNTHSVVYYTTGFSVKGQIEQMASHALPILDNLLADRLRIYPLRLPRSTGDAHKAICLLAEHMARLPKSYNLVILDCATPFLAQLSPTAKIDFFSACREMCNSQRTIIVIAENYVFEKSTLPRLSYLFDYHILLEMVTIKFDSNHTEEKVVQKMSIRKMNGVDLDKSNPVRFEVLPGVGIYIIPLTKVSI